MADLPQLCDSGRQIGSKGQPEYWRGYKLRLSVCEGDIPVSAILASASTHDSHVAVPLLQMSAGRVHGALKVMAHLMFGVLVITALGIWNQLR